VRLIGRLGETEVGWELPVDPEKAVEGSTVGALAARAEIRDLEEGTSRLHEKGGSKQRGRRETRITKAIVELGVRYGLASSQTSFVAVEEREGDEAKERGRLVLVPQALTRGWGRMQAAAMASAPRMGAGVSFMRGPVQEMAPPDEYFSVDYCVDLGEFDSSMGPPQAPPASPMEEYEPRKSRRGRRGRGYDAVVMLQRADGSWALDDRLAEAAELRYHRVRRLLKELADIDNAESVIATAAAIAFLHERARESQSEWHLLARKAERWLEDALAGTRHTLGEVMDSVARLWS